MKKLLCITLSLLISQQMLIADNTYSSTDRKIIRLAKVDRLKKQVVSLKNLISNYIIANATLKISKTDIQSKVNVDDQLWTNYSGGEINVSIVNKSEFVFTNVISNTDPSYAVEYYKYTKKSILTKDGGKINATDLSISIPLDDDVYKLVNILVRATTNNDIVVDKGNGPSDHSKTHYRPINEKRIEILKYDNGWKLIDTISIGQQRCLGPFGSYDTLVGLAGLDQDCASVVQNGQYAKYIYVQFQKRWVKTTGLLRRYFTFLNTATSLKTSSVGYTNVSKSIAGEYLGIKTFTVAQKAGILYAHDGSESFFIMSSLKSLDDIMRVQHGAFPLGSIFYIPSDDKSKLLMFQYKYVPYRVPMNPRYDYQIVGLAKNYKDILVNFVGLDITSKGYGKFVLDRSTNNFFAKETSNSTVFISMDKKIFLTSKGRSDFNTTARYKPIDNTSEYYSLVNDCNATNCRGGPLYGTFGGTLKGETYRYIYTSDTNASHHINNLTDKI
ncbi:hypothetical protein MNB_ARC-1_1142 [hydrothermal vent metagenome]|uniref:Uncharacterized protein n=1 Tax=hydrothermal vent metagenome TaxID=652676 RepID=A0A3B1DU69_9ZZZZ